MKASDIIYFIIAIILVIYVGSQIPNAWEVEEEMRQQQSEEIWRLYEQGN